jgi:hypothetical protein
MRHPGQTPRVISSLVEFEEATAFERWALEGLVPVPSSLPHTAVKDMEKNEVRVMGAPAVVRVYAGGVREVHVDLRPLAFGAAWKVLDLLVELALAQAGLGVKERMTIEAKVAYANQSAGICPPLSQDTPLWRALTSVYSTTKEVRHSLVHRLTEVDRATGDLKATDKNGQALPPITADQQEAFCRAVQRASQAALARIISPRERADLAWNLDQLGHLHEQPAMTGRPMERVPLAIVPTRMVCGKVIVNASIVLNELRENFPDRAAYDATFAIPDGRRLLVEVEQAPATEVAVDLDNLPSWARIWGGR